MKDGGWWEVEVNGVHRFIPQYCCELVGFEETGEKENTNCMRKGK